MVTRQKSLIAAPCASFVFGSSKRRWDMFAGACAELTT